jgi:predicted neutral ceramidase superfamily lipid hydrolase
MNLGFPGWSLEYVYPLLYIAIAIVVAIFTIIYRMAWRDFLVTVMIMALYGLTPLIFISAGWVKVLWPSYAAILAAIFLSFGIAIFARDKFGKEFNKRMKF